MLAKSRAARPSHHPVAQIALTRVPLDSCTFVGLDFVLPFRFVEFLYMSVARRRCGSALPKGNQAIEEIAKRRFHGVRG